MRCQELELFSQWKPFLPTLCGVNKIFRNQVLSESDQQRGFPNCEFHLKFTKKPWIKEM